MPNENISWKRGTVRCLIKSEWIF